MGRGRRRSPWDGLTPPPSSSSVSSPSHMSSESPELFHRRNMRCNMGMGQTTQMMIKKIKDLQMKLNPKKKVRDLKKVMKSPMMVVMSPKKVVMNPKMVVVNLMVMMNLKKVVGTQVMLVIMGRMVVKNQMKVVRDPKKVVMKKVKATPPQHQHHQHSPVGIYHQLKNQEHQMMMKNVNPPVLHHFQRIILMMISNPLKKKVLLTSLLKSLVLGHPTIILILRYGPLKKWTNLQPI